MELKMEGTELELFTDGSLYLNSTFREWEDLTPDQRLACVEFHTDLSGLVSRFATKMI
jgi:hypothetical protein